MSRTIAERARRAVIAVLPRAATVHTIQGDAGVDLLVNGAPVQVRWIGGGELRHVRALLAEGSEQPDIVAARQLSAGARAALTTAGVGWVDETGAAEVALPQLVISRSGRPPPKAEREARWNPSVLAVAEALLCGTTATVSATTEATGLSAAGCANALRTLTSLGLLTAKTRRGPAAGRQVDDPDRLLDAYAAAAVVAKARATYQAGLAWRDPVAGIASAGQRWSQLGVGWTATGAVAAAVLAPYLTSFGSAEVYLDADTRPGLEAAAEAAGIRAIEGGRLMLRPFPTVTTRRLATLREGIWVAPWPRVYADLRTTGVRGEEAAEHLREVVRGS